MDFLGRLDRTDADRNAAAYGGLVALLKSRPLVVIGAGVSRAQGYPDWKGFLERLADCARNAQPHRSAEIDQILKRPDPLWVADVLRSMLDPAVYASLLATTFSGKDDQFTDLHRNLCRLPFRHQLTTNYDGGLEAAAMDIGRRVERFDFDQLERLSGFMDTWHHPDCPYHVVHVHGSANRPQGIVLTLEDYRTRYTASNRACEALKVLFSFGTVFVGFSLTDQHVMDAFDRWSALFGSGEPKHFAIMMEPADGSAGVMRSHLRSRYRVEPVFYTHDATHAALPNLVARLVHDVPEGVPSLTPTQLNKVLSAMLSQVLVDQPERLDQERLRLPELAATVSASAGVRLVPEPATKAPRVPMDDEIDNAFRLVTDGHPLAAVASLERLLTRTEVAVDARLRFRVVANIGNALYAFGRNADAAQRYFEAAALRPEDPEARAFEPMAHYLLGDDACAFEVANSQCSGGAVPARVHAFRIRAAPLTIGLPELTEFVPENLAGDAEVLAALSDAARKRSEWDECVRLARAANAKAPEWPDTKGALAAALFDQSRQTAAIDVERSVLALDPDLAREIERLYSEVIAAAPGGSTSLRVGAAYFNRGTARRILGDSPGWKSDLEEAHHRQPDEPDIAAAYAIWRASEGDFDSAINALSVLPQSRQDARVVLVRARLLAERGGDESLTEARTLLHPWLARLNEVTPASTRMDLLVTAVFTERALPDGMSLEGLLALVPSGSLGSEYMAILRAEEAVIRTDTAAPERVREAHAAVGDNPDVFMRRSVGILAAHVGLDDLALNMLRTVVSPRFFSRDTQTMLLVAHRSKRDDFILEYCKTLREHGVRDARAYELEVATLRKYHEPERALQLLGEWLSDHPDDIKMRLRRCAFCFELNRLDILAEDASWLPPVTKVDDPEVGQVVVQILRQVRPLNDAAWYAYRLWRKFPDEQIVQTAYLTTVAIPFRNPLTLTPPPAVDAQSAVLIQRAGSNTPEWVVVEDEPPVSAVRGEYRPDHPLIAGLLGKRVGDSSDSGPARVTVVAVQHKVMHRARELMERYEERFPGQQLFRSFQTPPAPPANASAEELFGEAWTFMQKAEAERTRLVGVYQENLLPVSALANLLGKSVVATMALVGAKADVGVRACNGHTDELVEMVLAAEESKVVVLDSTAVGTLHLLGLSSMLARLPFKCVVPESALKELRDLLRELTLGPPERGYLSIINGQPVIREVSAAEHATSIQSLERTISAITANCEMVGGAALLGLSTELREKLPKVLKPGVAEALAEAKARGATLWTDDLTIAMLAHQEWKLRRTWTQSVLSVVRPAKGEPEGFADAGAVELFRHGYQFTSLGPAAFVRMFAESAWSIQSPLTQRALAFLWAFGGQTAHNCGVISHLLWRIWQDCPHPARREALVCTILAGLPSSIAGGVVSKQVYRCVVPPQLALHKPEMYKAFFQLKRFLRRWRQTNPTERARILQHRVAMGRSHRR